jgi:subtilisin family serine protease
LKETRELRLEFKDKDRIVRIAILDTGIDLRHEEFQNIKTYKNFCGNKDSDVEDLSDVQDLDGHGTQVASIILQLAPKAQLCIARILDGNVDRELTQSKTQSGEQRVHVTRPRSGIVAEVRIRRD